MLQEDLTGNSDVSKQKKIEPLPVDTKLRVQKPEGVLEKTKKKFFAEDVKTVLGHVFDSVIVPSAQKIVSDIVKQSIDWLIYGSKGNRQPPNNQGGYVSYGGYYNSPSYTSPAQYPQAPVRPPVNNIYTVNLITFDERSTAVDVLTRMQGAIARYGSVSVADFYDMINQKYAFTDNNWGWRNLNDVDILITDNGYRINFPPVVPIQG